MKAARPIGPMQTYLRYKKSFQFGALSDLGSKRLGAAERARTEGIDFVLNTITRLELGYLKLVHGYNLITRQPDEVTWLPLEETRIAWGKKRGKLEINRGSKDAQALNKLDVHICYLNMAGEMTWLNATMINGLGFSTGELIGRNLVSLVHPEDREPIEKWVKALIETGHAAPIEARIRKSGNGYIWGLIGGLDLKQKSQRVGASLSIRDITERKENEVRRIAKEKAAILGTILAGTLHELNNALTPVLSVLENSGYLFSHGTPAQIKECLDKVTEKVKQVRDFSFRLRSLGEDAGRNKKIAANLHDIVGDVAWVMREELNAADITLRVSCPRIVSGRSGATEDERFLFNVNKDAFMFVLIDLIKNAIDAIITRRAQDPEAPREINIALNKENRQGQEYYLLTIDDTGCGIPEEAMKKLFQPYYTTKPTGTGMGLATIEFTVQDHGGTVAISSEVNTGTKVLIRLPANPQEK
jgi:PAS domain S-box-containing protein